MNNPTMHVSMEQFEKASQGTMKALEDMGGMMRENMDAAMQSANVCMKGCSEINNNLTGLMQESMTKVMNAGKTVATCKSMPEAMTMHSEFMKDLADHSMASFGKMMEIAARMSQDVMAPLAQQANASMNKFTQRVKAA
jgi:phasin family protein